MPTQISAPRFLLVAVALLLIGCGDDGPTDPEEEPEDPSPEPVLVLGDDLTQDSVVTILTAAGVDTRLGPNYWEWDGSGLDDVSAVILLTAWEYSETMPDSVQETLLDFVDAGGGLVTTEWLLWGSTGGWYDLIAAAAPATYGGDYEYEPETYTVGAAAHPIAQGLPSSFSVPDGWSYSITEADPAPAKQAVVVVEGSLSGDAVVAGRLGQGRSVHWNMAGQYSGAGIWSSEVRTLLVNVVEWVSGASGS